MGLGRVELPTSRLSGVRSNHLSYRPCSLTTTPRRSRRKYTGPWAHSTAHGGVPGRARPAPLGRPELGEAEAQDQVRRDVGGRQGDQESARCLGVVQDRLARKTAPTWGENRESDCLTVVTGSARPPCGIRAARRRRRRAARSGGPEVRPRTGTGRPRRRGRRSTRRAGGVEDVRRIKFNDTSIWSRFSADAR